MLILAQIDEALKLTDHAAQQGVNWFLVGSNIVLGTAMVWMAKVFRSRHDKVCARLDTVQDDYTSNLKEMNTRQAVIISEHTVAATKLADVLECLVEIQREGRRVGK